MEESYAIQERAPEKIHVGQAPCNCEALESEVRFYYSEVRRQRWKTFRYIIYTALIAAFYNVMIMDVERNVLCDREDVICTQWENPDNSPKQDRT